MEFEITPGTKLRAIKRDINWCRIFFRENNTHAMALWLLHLLDHLTTLITKSIKS
jgi:hypothetical protein